MSYWTNTLTGTYASASSFTVSGSYVAYYPNSVRVRVKCDGAWIYSVVDSASYDGSNTTVTLTSSVLSGTVTDVETGSTLVGAEGNLCPHTHEDDSTGGSNVVGLPPTHEISGGRIRFMLPSGSWGNWIVVQAASQASSAVPDLAPVVSMSLPAIYGFLENKPGGKASVDDATSGNVTLLSGSDTATEILTCLVTICNTGDYAQTFSLANDNGTVGIDDYIFYNKYIAAHQTYSLRLGIPLYSSSWHLKVSASSSAVKFSAHYLDITYSDTYEGKRLGGVCPSASTNTALYSVFPDRAIVFLISVCNQGSTDATFRIAHVDGAIGDLSTADWLYYDQTVSANDTVFLMLDLAMLTTHTLVVWASTANVSFLAFGYEGND